jgi:hypothetical protein
MLVGTPPFYSEDRMTVYKQALSGKVSYPSHVSRFARHLISQFLQTAPSKRIGSLRGGVVDIKSHPFFKDFDWEALETRKMVRAFVVFSPPAPHPLSPRNAHCSSIQPVPWTISTSVLCVLKCHSLFVILTVVQYEESDAEFPESELSAIQQELFKGF